MFYRVRRTMVNAARTLAWLVTVLCSTAPNAAAQYKNMSFGVELGAALPLRPSVIKQGQFFTNNDQIPLRLAIGEHLGGEFNFKLNADHWWFNSHLNLGFFQFDSWGSGSGTCANPANDNQAYDCLAGQALGNILGIEAVVGPRVYLLTDRLRPYLEVAVSYMHLFDFSSNDGNACSVTSTANGINFCQNGGTFGDVFLPKTNILGVHGIFGVEFILVRDIALVLALDTQRWLNDLFNAEGNTVFTFSTGVLFYG